MQALLDTCGEHDPDFTNEGKGFYCTVPMVYPNAWTIDPHYKGKNYPGDCWQDFATYGEVEAHRRESHPEWYKDEVEYRRKKLMGTKPKAPATAEGFAIKVPFDFEPSSGGPGVPSRGRPVADEPSPEQIAYIATLATQKGVDVPGVGTKDEASLEITRLKALPDKGLRSNRYAGQCTECNGRVAAEAGFIRKVDGSWVTAHKPGECPAAVAPPAHVPDGRYAITAEAEHTSFYKVTNGRKPGVVFVDLLIGGGAGGQYDQQKVPFQQVSGILAKIAVDVEGAGKRYFEEAGACRRCGRALSKEKSRMDGYGSECVKHV